MSQLQRVSLTLPGSVAERDVAEFDLVFSELLDSAAVSFYRKGCGSWIGSCSHPTTARDPLQRNWHLTKLELMKALVLGATGGCGAPCLLRLLDRGVEVTVIVRSADRLPAAAKGHAKLKVVVAPEGHLALSVDEFAGHLRGADAVVSSLGHNLTFKGIYFPPRMLCVDSVRLICDTARQLARCVAD